MSSQTASRFFYFILGVADVAGGWQVLAATNKDLQLIAALSDYCDAWLPSLDRDPLCTMVGQAWPTYKWRNTSGCRTTIGRVH
jgi:hypothetical protein